MRTYTIEPTVGISGDVTIEVEWGPDGDNCLIYTLHPMRHNNPNHGTAVNQLDDVIDISTFKRPRRRRQCERRQGGTSTGQGPLIAYRRGRLRMSMTRGEYWLNHWKENGFFILGLH